MEGEQVGYLQSKAEEISWKLPRANPFSGRVGNLTQGPPDKSKLAS